MTGFNFLISSNFVRVIGTGERCLPGDNDNCGDGGKAADARLSYPKGEYIRAINIILCHWHLVSYNKMIAFHYNTRYTKWLMYQDKSCVLSLMIREVFWHLSHINFTYFSILSFVRRASFLFIQHALAE